MNLAPSRLHRHFALALTLVSLAPAARADAGKNAGSVEAAPVKSPPALTAARLVLVGDLPRTGAMTLDELKAMGGTAQTWTSHGTAHKVFGVRLDKVLAAHGFTPGKMGKDVPKSEKRAGWRKVALMTAADGFQSLISCAEMSEEMGPTVALLIWEMDGAPLPEAEGPVRLVVLTDQEPSRSIYALVRIEVLDVPSLAGKAR